MQYPTRRPPTIVEHPLRATYAGVAHERVIAKLEKRESVMSIPVFPETKVALKGKKGLIVGIANDQSIAWGCAKAFRALGAAWKD